MKSLFIVTIVLSILMIATQWSFAQTTTIYVVRHAEKEINDQNDKDPNLSEAGKKRAFDLLNYLQKEKIDVVLSTTFKRNTQTVAPVLAGRKLPISYYDAHDFKGLKNTIGQFHLGKKILIVGHSNTVLEICEALGAKPDIPKLTDADYSYIFEIKIEKDGKSSVVINHYGVKTTAN